MKKIFLLLFLAFLMIYLSCASKPATFEDAYTSFKKKLILTDAKSYTVVSGDVLTKITQDHYGVENGYYFPIIMAASSDVVTDPDKIAPGMVLTIPNLKTNLDNPGTKKNIKNWFKKVAGIYKDKGNTTVESELLKISDSL